MDIRDTPWDDRYFGIKTGRISIDKKMTLKDLERLITLAQSYELVVIDHISGEIVNDQLLACLNHNYLCDMLVKLTLNCNEIQGIGHTLIQVSNSMPFNKEILAISQSAFVYSRFKADPFLDKEKAQNIYVEWCKSSFNEEEKYFLTYSDGNQVVGYILFQVTKESIRIELIATSSRAQHQGIGSKMIKSLIHYAEQKGIPIIEVGTQIYNRPALRFYQKNGFKIEEMRMVYHYWPHKI